MESTARGEDSLSSTSSDQALSCKGWERFLPKRPLRVLLVEEDISTRQVVCALLSKCGYEVSCALDCSKAWDLLEQSRQSEQVFDLVLADAIMPVLSGTDLLTKIMSSDAHRDIPVIMMSAHDSLDMVFKCLLKGAKDFLVKPLRKNELRNLWQHVWRRNHVAGGSRSQGDAHGKKRKASRNLSSGDVSTGNYSLSSDINDQNAVKDERNSQCPGVRESDVKSKQPCTKLECNQTISCIQNDACNAQVATQKVDHHPPSEKGAECCTTLEASEASGTLAKAFDFFGAKTAESVLEQISSKSSNLDKACAKSSQECQVSPALELTLKQSSSTCNVQNDPTSSHGVRQSSCSAFSKYTTNSSLIQQSCIVRSSSLPSEKGTYGCDLNGNPPPSIDGSRSCMDICGKANDRTVVPGHCNSSTLHFPKATHLKHGKQFGNPPFSCMPPFCDESCRQLQDNSLSNFRSPSLNSSTALPAANEASLVEPNRLNLQRDAPVAGSLAGSAWCSTGSDKEDLSSNAGKLGQLPCMNADCVGTNSTSYGPFEHPNKSLNAEDFTNLKADGSLPELPTYTRVSGRGSNDGSDRGSNVLEEHLAGKSVNCVAGQDGHSLTGWPTNEDGRMDTDSRGIHAYDESNPTDQRPLVYDYRSSFREAALHKFRQKRKMRCFEKKVRYQSRKKLAEQRPRVKGQFVRRVVPNMATELNTNT